MVESMDELCTKLLDEMHYNHNIETDDIESNLNINENKADEVFSTTSPKETHSVDTSASNGCRRITMKIFETGFRGFSTSSLSMGRKNAILLLTAWVVGVM